MTTPLAININRRDGVLALVAAGEIDLSNIDSFSSALTDAIAKSSGQKVTVDLGAVDYLDSGGINVLFSFADRIRLIVKPLLIPVLTISGLTELATVESSSTATDS